MERKPEWLLKSRVYAAFKRIKICMQADGREVSLQKGNDALCVRRVRANTAQRRKDERMM